jgi:hypothetical protein
MQAKVIPSPEQEPAPAPLRHRHLRPAAHMLLERLPSLLERRRDREVAVGALLDDPRVHEHALAEALPAVPVGSLAQRVPQPIQGATTFA